MSRSLEDRLADLERQVGDLVAQAPPPPDPTQYVQPGDPRYYRKIKAGMKAFHEAVERMEAEPGLVLDPKALGLAAFLAEDDAIRAEDQAQAKGETLPEIDDPEPEAMM